jgi:alkanesulfonate monooxygenase SsuD/methylene tetrahydromethanopterin reductase-like flavin-dependent oxidoreductase (luciferase family)
MVTGVTYRYPGLLVKTVTTLDVLSHGRAYFGIGAAWNEEEHVGLGVPFPPIAERFEHLEETLQIAQQMWAGDEKPYQGKHYQLGRPLNSPLSVQKPHPPILIGGAGERKTLRLVAQYGDACNLSLRMGRDEAKRKLEVLREHCQRIGRPYTDIEKTTLETIRLTRDGRDNSLTPAAAIAYFRELAAMGVDQALVNMPNVTDLEPYDLFATEVIPAVEQIEVAGR